jgi:hypothetical protein
MQSLKHDERNVLGAKAVGPFSYYMYNSKGGHGRAKMTVKNKPYYNEDGDLIMDTYWVNPPPLHPALHSQPLEIPSDLNSESAEDILTKSVGEIQRQLIENRKTIKDAWKSEPISPDERKENTIQKALKDQRATHLTPMQRRRILELEQRATQSLETKQRNAQRAILCPTIITTGIKQRVSQAIDQGKLQERIAESIAKENQKRTLKAEKYALKHPALRAESPLKEPIKDATINPSQT